MNKKPSTHLVIDAGGVGELKKLLYILPNVAPLICVPCAKCVVLQGKMCCVTGQNVLCYRASTDVLSTWLRGPVFFGIYRWINVGTGNCMIVSFVA
jgi:hypothetical protein